MRGPDNMIKRGGSGQWYDILPTRKKTKVVDGLTARERVARQREEDQMERENSDDRYR